MRPNLKLTVNNSDAPLSKIETLLNAYRSADRSSQQVLEKATQVLFETSDPEKVSQANRAISLSTEIVNTAFSNVVDAKSENLSDVLMKLQIWHESVVGENSHRMNLSPMEQLLSSIYDDILQLSQA